VVNQVNGRAVNAQAPNSARELNAPGRVETGQSVAADGGALRREKTVNYEVDRSIERFKPSKGQLRRISAAVVLDYKPSANGSVRAPYSQDELRQINTLIRDAVGYVQARGDTVSVANLPFNAPPTSESAPTAAESWWTPEVMDQAKKMGWTALGAALLYLFVLRPLLRPASVPAPQPTEPAMTTTTSPNDVRREIEEKQEAWARQREVWAAEERLREQDEQLRRDQEEKVQADRKRRLDELLSYAEGFAGQQPEQTALLLKSWASSRPPVGSTGSNEASGASR
jgi:flagellar M-ring protein FliF